MSCGSDTDPLAVISSQTLLALASELPDAQSNAAQPPVPVPQTTLIPVTLDSYPFGAADHLNVPEDLSKVGYVEEEYFVSDPLLLSLRLCVLA
jgi:hypothetical protein